MKESTPIGESALIPVSDDDVCKCHGVPRVNKGDHKACRVKHREQNLRAVARYHGTAKGMLTRIRAEAKRRGNR